MTTQPQQPESSEDRPVSGGRAALERMLPDELAHLEGFIDRNLGPRIRLRESVGDVVQSVCRDALEAGDDFEDQGPQALRRYLERRALHRIYRKWEHHRAEKRDMDREVRPGASGDGKGISQLAKISGTPSRAAMRRQSIDQVHAAIERLPTKYRQAVILHRLLGLTSGEIARETGQTDGAVRNQIYRGIAQLGVLLAQSA